MTIARQASNGPPSPNKLFVRLWSAAKSGQDHKVNENFFSECLAGALNADIALARALVRRLNQGRDRLAGTSIARAAIKVTPQFMCVSKGRRCFVDLRIEVGSRVAIGVEVKLDAPEGSHSSGDRQRVKYLGIRTLTHIAFITDYLAKVEKIPKTRRYLRPEGGRDHFLWSDFYSVIQAASRRRTAPQFAQALLELFHHLHLEPVHPDLPDLATAEGTAAFRPLWDVARAILSQRYEHVGVTRSNATINSWNSDGSGGAWKLSLGPALYPGVLHIWLYMDNRTSQVRVAKELVHMFATRGGAFRGATAELRRGKASPGIALYLPYRSIFSRRSSDRNKQKRLGMVVKSVLSAIT